MKIALFAGGPGQRLWPLSTQKLPKQFAKVYNGKSTLDLCLELFANEYGWDNMILCLPAQFKELALKEYPKLLEKNILGEPVRREVGPAVAMAVARQLADEKGDEPLGIMWTDDLIGDGKQLIEVLNSSKVLLERKIRNFVFIGEEPRFANQNVGWLRKGDRLEIINGYNFFKFAGFKYRPDQETADKWFEAKSHLYHSAFHLTTANFLAHKFQKEKPDIHRVMLKIVEHLKKNEPFDKTFEEFEMINFDNSILESLKEEECCVAKCTIDSIAIGTHVAYKDYYQEEKDANVFEGTVIDLESNNTMVVNRDPEILIATIGLKDMIIVHNNGSTLICHRNDIPKIKDLLVKVSENEELKKYL